MERKSRKKPAGAQAPDPEGLRITRDEMSYPDWRERLARARRESREGKGILFEDYLKKIGKQLPL